jgi:hypothetical protein
MNSCSESILLQSHHNNTIYTQFRPFSAHAPPVRPQSAPEPSQHIHACVSRIIQAYSGTITPFFSPINLPHSRSLVHTGPAPMPSSIPLQHLHSSQPSSTCPPSCPGLPSLSSSAQHPRQPPFPALIMFSSCFGLCPHTHIITHAPTQRNMTVCTVLNMDHPLLMLKSARLACTSPANITKTHNPTLLSPCALIPEPLLKIIAWQPAWTCPLAVCNHFPVLRFCGFLISSKMPGRVCCFQLSFVSTRKNTTDPCFTSLPKCFHPHLARP